jgi:hypothetical protein
MEIDQVQENILNLESMISERMKKYIHYKSMRNFINHFDEINDKTTQRRILALMYEYFEEIKGSDYDFDVYTSTELAKKYLFDIAEVYKQDSNFMRIIKIQHVFLYGILIDSLLYLSGVLSLFRHIPIVTTVFLFYYLFVAIFKERQGRVYGMFY